MAETLPLLPPTLPDSIPSAECVPTGTCNTVIYQLELILPDGTKRPLTMGDFSEEECKDLLAKVAAGVIIADPNNKLECVPYDVKREIL